MGRDGELSQDSLACRSGIIRGLPGRSLGSQSMETIISPGTRKHSSTPRRLGWLAIALLVSLTMVGSGAIGVYAADPEVGGGQLTTQTLTPVPPIQDLTHGTDNPSLASDVCKQGDFGFVVDRSGSIGSAGSTAEKAGVKGFADAFEAIGSGLYAGTRFAGTSDSAAAFTTGFVAAGAFKTAVDGLPGVSGRTPTRAGIATGVGNTANDRASAPNVLFVVTDGSPNVPDGGLGYSSNPAAWLFAANAAISAANDARTAGWVVKAIYVGAPDSGLPFSSTDDQAWVNAVMTQIGGGSFTQIGDFSSLASALLISTGCVSSLTITKTITGDAASFPGARSSSPPTAARTGRSRPRSPSPRTAPAAQ